MANFEYKTIDEYEIFGEASGFPVEKMNELGKVGWELVCMTKGNSSKGVVRVCIFKRKLFI